MIPETRQGWAGGGSWQAGSWVSGGAGLVAVRG